MQTKINNATHLSEYVGPPISGMLHLFQYQDGGALCVSTTGEIVLTNVNSSQVPTGS